MASQSSNTVSVKVGALSTAIAVAIQQATQLGSTGTGAPVADAADSEPNAGTQSWCTERRRRRKLPSMGSYVKVPGFSSEPAAASATGAPVPVDE